MSRAHTPRLGVDRGRELVRRELLALDRAVPTEETRAFADQLGAAPKPARNRAERRAAARAQPRKGRQP